MFVVMLRWFTWWWVVHVWWLLWRAQQNPVNKTCERECSDVRAKCKEYRSLLVQGASRMAAITLLLPYDKGRKIHLVFYVWLRYKPEDGSIT